MQPNSQCNLNNKYALIPLASSRKSQKRGKREEKFVGDDKNERKAQKSPLAVARRRFGDPSFVGLKDNAESAFLGVERILNEENAWEEAAKGGNSPKSATFRLAVGGGEVLKQWRRLKAARWI